MEEISLRLELQQTSLSLQTKPDLNTQKAKMKFSSAISLLLVGSAAAFAPASTSQSRGTVSQFFPSAHPNYQAPNAQQPKDWRVATSDPALVVDERSDESNLFYLLRVRDVNHPIVGYLKKASGCHPSWIKLDVMGKEDEPIARASY